MLFPSKTDFVQQITGITLGSSQTFDITREFPIDAMMFRVTGTPSGNIATATADGLLGLLKRLRIIVSDGARTRQVVDCSGRGLLEFALQKTGTLDLNTWACKDVTTIPSPAKITYPVFCSDPQLADPMGSLFMLPAPRYNQNIQVIADFASQAELDSAATPTAAFSAITLDVFIRRRRVTLADFPSIDWELTETTQAFASSGSNLLYELPVPGNYLGLLLRMYTSATARGDITNGEMRLELLGNVLHRFRYDDIKTVNEYSIAPQAATGAGSPFAGSLYLDFISDKVGETSADLGSVLDANVLAGVGARLNLKQDITGGANVQEKILIHRAYGDLSKLKLALRGGKK